MRVFKLLMDKKDSSFCKIPCDDIRFFTINFTGGFGEIYTNVRNFQTCIKFYDTNLPGFDTLNDVNKEMERYWEGL